MWTKTQKRKERERKKKEEKTGLYKSSSIKTENMIVLK